jgi:hypothetical protein
MAQQVEVSVVELVMSNNSWEMGNEPFRTQVL